METIIPAEHIFPAKNLKGKYCLSPWVQVAINSNGNVGLCGCGRWQPLQIGNIFKNSLEDLLKNSIAKNIRQSIIDGTYIYCDSLRCGIMRHDGLNSHDTLPESVKWAIEDSERFFIPHHIVISLDRTCNLYCPSCRHSVIKIEDKEKQRELSNILTKNLLNKPTDKRIELTLDTEGEVFASNLLLDFIGGISSKDFPNIEFDFLSNGILAPKRWHRLGDMQQHVKKISVSFDSPDPATYEKLRRGGDWNDLVDALNFLKIKKQELGMKFNVRMVVQKDNYHQMKQFYDFSKNMGADDIQFQRITNWGTFTKDQFADIDVFDPVNPLYNDAIQHLQTVEKLPDTLFWHGLLRT